MVQTRKLGVPLIASLLMATAAPAAFADSSFVQDATGPNSGAQAHADGAVTGSAGDSTSGAARADDPFDGGDGSAIAGGNTGSPSSAASQALNVGVLDSAAGRSANASVEILDADGGQSGSSANSNIQPLNGGNQSLVSSSVFALNFGSTGTINAASLASTGDLATDAGVSTSLADPLGLFASAVNSVFVDTQTGDFRLRSAAVESVGSLDLGTFSSLPPVRQFDVAPLLANAAFSLSLMEQQGGNFVAFSEAWKGAASGDTETVSSAESLDSHTMGTSGPDAGGDNTAFTQAFSAPEDEAPLFASATAESKDGGAAYSTSAIGREKGTLTNSDGSLAPFTSNTAIAAAAFDGDGIAQVEALAGQVFSSTEINDQFDGETLSGIAEVTASILSPSANAESAVRVEGNGSVINRTVSNSIDLADTAGVLAATSFVSNEVTVDQTLTGNNIVETGSDHSVEIANAGVGLQGLLNVNQDAGNTNNQANIRSIAITDQDDTVLLNDVTGKVSTTGNRVETHGSDRSNVITDNSFANGNGILGVNQTSGSANQTTNVLALAVGIGDNAVSIGDIDLEVEHSENELVEAAPGNREDRIDGGAFSGFSGVAQVNQVSGDLNQVTSTVAVSVSVQ